jgi:transcriptional regulator with XRE-family HTH domain
MGVAVGTVGNWETNSREPDIQTLTRLADYFRITVDYLLGHDTILKIPEELSDVQIAFYEGTKDLKDEDLKALIPIAAALKNKK